jgi:ATP-binding protein involved in chromosome partitioning
LAEDLGVPLIGSIPLDPEVVPGGDQGRPVVNTTTAAATAIRAIAERLVDLVPPADLETCTGRIAKILTELEEMPA